MRNPELETHAGTLFDYDLNIYHVEEAIEGPDGTESWEYTNQWYVDIYEYTTNEYGASQQTHVTGPFEITDHQRDLLQLGTDGYFTDDDSWYGMWGFLKDYKDKLLPELLDILYALPTYKEEVLF